MSTAKEENVLSPELESSLSPSHDSVSVVEDPASDVSDGLLSLEVKGVVGWVERLPLWVKIVLLVTVSTLGMLIISAAFMASLGRYLKSASESKTLVTMAANVEEVVDRVHEEMGAAVAFLLVQEEAYKTEYEEIAEKVEQESKKHMQEAAVLVSADHEGSTLVQTAANSLTALTNLRKNVLSLSISPLKAYEEYEEAIESAVAVIRRGSVIYGGHISTLSFNVYIEFESAYRSLVALGAMAMNEKNNSKMLEKFKREAAVKNSLEHLLLQTLDDATIKLYKNLQEENEDLNVDEMLEVIATNQTAAFTAKEWLANTTELFENYESVQLAIQQHIFDWSSSEVAYSTAFIIVAIGIFLFFMVTSFFCTVGFSRTIVGPWKRLNYLQELVMARFVPKEFLKLMKWHKITDVELGGCSEKEISVVIITIQNFYEAVCCLESQERFKLLNSYVQYISPSITGGFIDKNMGEFITVIFTNAATAFKAAVSVHQATNSFNNIIGTKSLQISTVLVHGSCSFGTVGESKRMESAFISRQMMIALYVSRVCRSKLQASFITTEQSLRAVKPLKKLAYRRAGTWRIDNIGDESLVEILLEGETKIKTCRDFSDGVNKMHHGNFSEAAKCFDTVLQHNPSDHLAKVFREVTQRMVQENSKVLLGLTIIDVLQEKVLHDAFKEYAKHEFSAENINLYHDIKRFKQWFHSLSPPLRSKEAKKICDEYLNVKGKQSANLTTEMCLPVMTAVETNQELPVSLFDEVEQATIFQMNDTLQRFKKTGQFMTAYLASTKAIVNKSIPL